MIRVVLDTNIYISAILFGGNPEVIIDLAKKGEIEVIISEFIIGEIAEILRRKFGWENWQILEVIDELREFTILVIPKERVSIISEDPIDNRILECALEGKASYIVSGDNRHLLPLREFKRIKIISVSDFLECFGERSFKKLV